MNFKLTNVKAIGSLVLGLILNNQMLIAGYCKEDYCTTYFYNLTHIVIWNDPGWTIFFSGIMIILVYLIWSLLEKKN